MKKAFISIIILAFLLGGFYFIFLNNKKQENFNPNNNNIEDNKNITDITDFVSCLNNGNLILESYPRQCRTSSGQLFIEDIGNEMEKADLIKVNFPRPNQKIFSPLNIEGEARGFWYFEATFPVVIKDSFDNIIVSGFATAQTDWMTEDFVAFKSQIIFEAPEKGSQGKIILQKDNPSGLPEHDDFLEIPIIFE